MTTEIGNLKTLQKFIKQEDNSKSVQYMSPVPQDCIDFPCVLGIDEAGRGPVLGPMVYGTAFCPINRADLLASLECADSKVLTEKKRDEIFEHICESSKSIGWGVDIISPNTICNSMFRRSKCSLNEVSMNAAIGLIRRAIDAKVNIAHIYVDTVGKANKYQDYLTSIFPNYKITVAPKADSTYPIVSAASICAKVTRDHALKVWEFQEELDISLDTIGSGYPADPDTKKFLLSNCDPVFGYPQLVRFSWSTTEKLLQEHAYHVDWEEVEEEQKAPTNNLSITSFFKSTNSEKKKSNTDFFVNRCLEKNNFFN